MIGEKKLKDVKTSIRDAFARKGVDVNQWLDEQMAKLRGPGNASAIEPLGLIRNGLRPGAVRKKPKKLRA